ncbi:MAG: DUF4410 domain-containing protein [Deltaproteobacteria bacterium]|nr:DUF4410 domain-containing protein [Deltaproteobacteria bacterium]
MASSGRSGASYILPVTIFFFIAACGQTAVRPLSRIQDTNLPPPARILVCDFTMDEAAVKEYQGILRQQPSENNPAERESQIKRHAADAATGELVKGLRGLGFAVAPVARGTLAGDNELLIDGKFLTVDQGNPLRRLLIGFGSGASKVETRVELYHGIERRKLLDFTTRSDSGKMPGAAATVPASAAVQGGVTASVIASGAIGTGYEAYRTDVAQMARATAEQSVRYLSEYFAKQGWIRADQVKKARIAY